jgi:hypothetical protein
MSRIQTAFCVAAIVVFFTGAGCETAVFVEDLPPEQNYQRIVGGQSFTGLPAVGALIRNGYTHCSGTLIGPRLVLTAAHCVSGVYASSLRFVIGPSVGDAQHVLQVSAAQAHPNFSFSSISNDIGVVTLSQNAPVEPMGVLSSMDSSWVGTDLLHVGYGRSSSYGGVGTKRAVWMPITQVGSKTFAYGGGGRNTCSGDSGGPAFYESAGGKLLVAGVTSHGDQYCSQFGVDTRVDRYLSWLGVSGSGGGSAPAPAPDPTPPPQDNCQGETYEGRCDGETVIWCENNQVRIKDCAALNMQCLYDSQKKYFGCGTKSDPPPPPAPPPSDPPPSDPPPPTPPSDPCQGETYKGRCDGETVVWCEDNQIKTLQCNPAANMKCGFDKFKNIYNCVDRGIGGLLDFLITVWLL